MSSFVKASGSITPDSADPGEEFPFLHTITVVDRVVSVDKPELVQNNINTETVTLNLDSEWEGLSTVINIGNDEPPTSLIWSGQPVVIPAELMTDVGALNVSVVGYGDDGAVRSVTKKADAKFTVVASGYVEDDVPVPDPTTLLGQLIQAADNANQAADRFNQASEDIESIGPAIEKVQASEANAKQSETNAASSAESASQSASTASTSAEAARTSETNAATSATAAQQAVDGFGLEVGTTTTGEPGSDAAVEIQKTGTKYTANFTIPRGDVGPAGVNENVPLGSTSGVVAQASDAYPALPRKVQVHGRTVENLRVTYDQATNDGVTLDTNDTGLITVTGNASTDTELAFTPSGVHTVKPTKLIVAGKNLIPIENISSGSSNGINWKANDDKTFTVSGTSTNIVDISFIPPSSSWSLPKGRYTVKAIGDLQNGIQIFIRQKGSPTWFTSLNYKSSVGNIDIDEDTVLAECSVRIPSGVTLENSVYGIQIELGDSDTSYETPNIKSLDFTQSISLADGDTLTIDRDGTTRIIHAEGEPTVLDNMTLPELPAPTFNVYTTGGYVPPNVAVDYEQDVNLVLQALKAKIAVLEVDRTIMQGA